MTTQNKKILIGYRLSDGRMNYWVEGEVFSTDPEKAQEFPNLQQAEDFIDDGGWDLPLCQPVVWEKPTGYCLDKAYESMRRGLSAALEELDEIQGEVKALRKIRLRNRERIAFLERQIKALQQQLRMALSPASVPCNGQGSVGGKGSNLDVQSGDQTSRNDPDNAPGDQTSRNDPDNDPDEDPLGSLEGPILTTDPAPNYGSLPNPISQGN